MSRAIFPSAAQHAALTHLAKSKGFNTASEYILAVADGVLAKVGTASFDNLGRKRGRPIGSKNKPKTGESR